MKDSILGKLPEARYAARDEQYAKEQDTLSKEIAEIEAAINGYEKSRKSADKFIALVGKYENFDTMTTPMLLEFVEKSLCMSVTARAVLKRHGRLKSSLISSADIFPRISGK